MKILLTEYQLYIIILIWSRKFFFNTSDWVGGDEGYEIIKIKILKYNDLALNLEFTTLINLQICNLMGENS